LSKELLKTLLDYDFYTKYQHNITENLFPEKHIRALYRTLQQSHKATASSLTVEELKSLHYIYNPALTQAAKHSLDSIFDELAKVTISPVVGEETLKQAIRNTLFTEAASLCMDAADNKVVDLDKLRELLVGVDASLDKKEYKLVSTDIDDLLAEDAQHFKWKYHHPGLKEALEGIGPGIFTLVAARPNAGKTAFMVSNIFHPEGWIAQGANVHLVANEESATRTILRGVSAWTGLTKEEIIQDKEKVKELFSPVRKKLSTINADTLGVMSIEELENYLKSQDNIDILILDQIDKMMIGGNFANETDRIRKLYTYVRNMTVRYNIPIIGVSQASEAAEGKLYYGFESLENSKTGKAAEVDVCICIGKESFSSNQGNDTGFRVANLAKNKPTGVEKPVTYMLQPQISRITA
jgi:replicative DNA helicase